MDSRLTSQTRKSMVALLMPVFNNLDFTKKCLDRLGQTFANGSFSHTGFEVVVVDDGSSDGTSEWIRKHHPGVILLQGSGNLWWSGGVNMAARHAVEEMGADYLLLWNNDVIAEDNYFTELDRLTGSLPAKEVVGSKIFKAGGEGLIWSYGGVFNPKTGTLFMVGTDRPDSGEFDSPREVDWLPGMGTLIPSGLIREIGYWDAESFPQYHGDSDFTLRAGKAGYTIRVYPQLVLYNDKTSSGLKHGGTLRGLHKALTSIRSNTRISTSFRFYRRHARSPRAYLTLYYSYFRLFGGFVKWKIISVFKRQNA